MDVCIFFESLLVDFFIFYVLLGFFSCRFMPLVSLAYDFFLFQGLFSRGENAFFNARINLGGFFIWIFTGRFLSLALYLFHVLFGSFLTELWCLLYDFFLFQMWISRKERTFFQCQNKFKGDVSYIAMPFTLLFFSFSRVVFKVGNFYFNYKFIITMKFIVDLWLYLA